MSCPRIDRCPLFPHLKLTLEIWKTAYCEDDDQWNSCARIAASARGKVADTLLPDGTNLGTDQHRAV